MNICYGLIERHIIVPFIIHGNLTSYNYLNLLRHRVLPALIEVFANPANNQLVRNEVYFQQVVAPPHFDRMVKDYLIEIFPEIWKDGRRTI